MILFLVSFLILILGFFNSIFVNPSLFIYHWDSILIIVLTIFTLKKAFDKDSMIAKGFHYKDKKSDIQIFISILVGIPILLSIFIHISLPSLMHKVVNKELMKRVIISQKTHKEKHCLTYIYTTDEVVKGFCIDKDIYNSVDVGDRLLLKGTSSIFGFSLNQVLKDDGTLFFKP